MVTLACDVWLCVTGGAQPVPDAHSPVTPVHRHASSDGQWARSQEGALGSTQGRPRVSVRGKDPLSTTHT